MYALATPIHALSLIPHRLRGGWRAQRAGWGKNRLNIAAPSASPSASQLPREGRGSIKATLGALSC
jgi:hypothetical protein